MNIDDIKVLYKKNNLCEQADKLFKTKISPDFLSLIDLTDSNDPLVKQILPTDKELIKNPKFVNNPVGDNEALQTPGLLHKYNNRVLLITTPNCVINCRYCFRRNFDYKNSVSTDKNLLQAMSYINSDNSIKEVILSGGDPLTLSNKKLFKICDALLTIKHVKTLRIHSRYPIVDNQRIDEIFLAYFKNYGKKLVFVCHINHPNELSKHSAQSFLKLKHANFFLLNQSVLLKGINDHADTLVSLSHKLFQQGVLPYYLHLLDKVQGAGHFQTDSKTNKTILKNLNAQLPGYLVPKIVQEIAGEANKVPFC